MAVAAKPRNFELELREIDQELEQLNSEYDRLAATGPAQAMDRVGIRIAAAQQCRRNVEAAQRGDFELRREARMKVDTEERGRAYQLSETAVTAVQREAAIIDRLVNDLRESFARVRLAEKEVVPPIYRFLSLADREFPTVELKTLLVEASELEDLLRGTTTRLAIAPLRHSVAARCARALAQINRILYQEQQGTPE
jgi:hypothetical protein